MRNTWERIHLMEEEDMKAYAELHKVEMEMTFEDLNAAADYVCAELQIEKVGNEEDHPGAEIDKEIEAYRKKHNCTYAKALHDLGQNDPEFRKRWAAIFE